MSRDQQVLAERCWPANDDERAEEQRHVNTDDDHKPQRVAAEVRLSHVAKEPPHLTHRTLETHSIHTVTQPQRVAAKVRLSHVAQEPPHLTHQTLETHSIHTVTQPQRVVAEVRLSHVAKEPPHLTHRTLETHSIHTVTADRTTAQPWASECPDVKNTNDGVTRYDTGCFIAVSWQQWASKG